MKVTFYQLALASEGLNCDNCVINSALGNYSRKLWYSTIDYVSVILPIREMIDSSFGAV